MRSPTNLVTAGCMTTPVSWPWCNARPRRWCLGDSPGIRPRGMKLLKLGSWEAGDRPVLMRLESHS